jgi:hypothetical protein
MRKPFFFRIETDANTLMMTQQIPNLNKQIAQGPGIHGLRLSCIFFC